MKTTKTFLFSFTLILSLVLCIAILDLPVKAQNTSFGTVVLSNEGFGNAIELLINGGYGNLNIYQVLLRIEQNTDPSVSGIITPDFLNTLQSLPSSSQIFTAKLSDYSTTFSTILISTDGTVEPLSMNSANYFGASGTGNMDTIVSGVGTLRAVYNSTSSPIFVSHGGADKNYNVVAIITVPPVATATATNSTTPTTPEFPSMMLLPLALAILFVIVIFKRKSYKGSVIRTSNP